MAEVPGGYQEGDDTDPTEREHIYPDPRFQYPLFDPYTVATIETTDPGGDLAAEEVNLAG